MVTVEWTIFDRSRKMAQKPKMAEVDIELNSSQITIKFNGMLESNFYTSKKQKLTNRNIDNTAHLAFSGTYFDLSPAMIGQKAPTHPSNMENKTNRTKLLLTTVTRPRASDAMPRMTVNLGLNKSLSREPSITKIINSIQEVSIRLPSK